MTNIFFKKGGVSKRISFHTSILTDVYQIFLNSHVTYANNDISIVFQRKHHMCKKLLMEKITHMKGKMWCGPNKKELEVSVIHKSFVNLYIGTYFFGIPAHLNYTWFRVQ